MCEMKILKPSEAALITSRELEKKAQPIYTKQPKQTPPKPSPPKSSTNSPSYYGNQYTQTPSPIAPQMAPPASPDQLLRAPAAKGKDVTSARALIDDEMEIIENEIEAINRKPQLQTLLSKWADSIIRNERLGKVIQYSKDKMYFAVSFYVAITASGLCDGNAALGIVSAAMHRRTGRYDKRRKHSDGSFMSRSTYAARTIRRWYDNWRKAKHGTRRYTARTL
jgi:hypothetical protein